MSQSSPEPAQLPSAPATPQRKSAGAVTPSRSPSTTVICADELCTPECTPSKKRTRDDEETDHDPALVKARLKKHIPTQAVLRFAQALNVDIIQLVKDITSESEPDQSHADILSEFVPSQSLFNAVQRHNLPQRTNSVATIASHNLRVWQEITSDLHKDLPHARHISWAEFYMNLAICCSLRSKDPKTGVGCVIVDREGAIISCGYNGNPVGIPDDSEIWRDEEKKKNFVVHAESKAFINVDRERCRGGMVFVTLFPCVECAKLIISYGIAKIVYWSDRSNKPGDTKPDSYELSRMLLDKSTVTYAPFFKRRETYTPSDNLRLDVLVSSWSKQVSGFDGMKRREGQSEKELFKDSTMRKAPPPAAADTKYTQRLAPPNMEEEQQQSQRTT